VYIIVDDDKRVTLPMTKTVTWPMMTTYNITEDNKRIASSVMTPSCIVDHENITSAMMINA
jgi:hypothetical protein